MVIERLKFSRATTVMILVGMIIAGIALCQGGINAILMTRDIRNRAGSHLEDAARTTLDQLGAVLQRSTEDLKTFLAHEALQSYFTALAFEDVDEMTASTAIFEAFLKQVQAAKPQYAHIQLAQAGGAPFLQINHGQAVEAFDAYAVRMGEADRRRLLAPAGPENGSPAVLHTSFFDAEDGWVVLSAAPLRYQRVAEGILWLYQPVSEIFRQVLTELGESGIACTIVDGEGKVVAQSEAVAGTPPAGFGAHADGWLITEKRFEPLGWTVKVGLPEEKLYAQQRTLRLVGLFALFVSLVVAMGALWGLKVYQEGLERKIGEREQELLDRSLKLKTALDGLEEAKEELQRKNETIEADRRKIQGALDEIFSLIQKVSKAKNFQVKFVHPSLKKCWERMECGAEGCPCYGKGPLRCWQTVGTYCQCPDHHSRCYQDAVDCETCAFYQEATQDPIFQIGEQFNNMMHILESQSSELQKAYADLKASQVQMLQQEKMATVGQLAAGVAHEINNPLGFIISNIKSLEKYVGRILEFIAAQGAYILAGQDGAAPDPADLEELKRKIKLDYIAADVQDLLKESLEGAERVREIVQNLKSFSRVDQATRQRASINDCLESAIKVIWNELKYKATVTREYGDLPPALCYPQQLNQVFMNLLINAVQAIDQKGDITVRTWAEDERVCVSVADTGRGIPEDKIGRIFEPFFTTKEVGKGTGLGLSISYDIIVKNHDGTISVESEEGKGTVFTIQLPVG